jgi:hypothetical protein
VVAFTEVHVLDFNVFENGTLMVKLQNQYGKNININSVNATYENTTVQSNPAIINLSIGKSTDAIDIGTIGNFTKGTSFKVKLDIWFTDVETGVMYRDSGTLSGIVQ